MNDKTKKESGIALYITVLISSIVLAVGVSIGNIFLKEAILSIAARDSQIAFYAADSGLECARFWDIQLGGTKFGSTTDPLNSIKCANQIITTGSQNTPTYEVVSRIGCYAGDLQDEGTLENDCVPGGSTFTGPGTIDYPMFSYFTLSFDTPPVQGKPAKNFPDAPCAKVTVRKSLAPNNPSDLFQPTDPQFRGYYTITTIESRGYNTCVPGSPKRIERAIRIQ